MVLFDSHLHIIDSRFPLIQNDGYLPNEFSVEDYLQATEQLPMFGGAVVSGSFQGFDQTYLLDALKKLGSNYVGVTQVPFSISDEDLNILNLAGIKALRFNLKRGGSESIERLEEMAKRVFDLFRWHVEFYVDSKDLGDLKERLIKLPAYSIDHLGLTNTGKKDLLYLIEKGCRLKATGFGRINFEPIPLMKEVYNINPSALMFGTDLPSTRARKPFEASDIDLVIDSFSESESTQILYSNALNWYKK